MAGRTYVHAMNCIHYMHDKYFYERLEMALHDRDILRTMAFGIAGLSVVADSLSAIKYGKIRVIRDQTGLIVDYQNEGNNATPQFGNNDDRVDQIASGIVTSFMDKIRKHPTYRNATHTQSVLTITSNVVYGKATGNTPGRPPQGRAVRARRQPDAWPRQPWLAGILPVGRKASLQGFAGRHQLHRVRRAAKGAPVRNPVVDEAVKAFDVYFDRGGFHMNLNVIDKETLEDAMKNPGQISATTIRVSGYAVNFVRLTPRAAEGRDQPYLPRPDLSEVRHVDRAATRSRKSLRPQGRDFARRAR